MTTKALQSILTKTEVELLEDCEQRIEDGKLAFLEVGNALIKVRDEKLYRTKFKTFQDYCKGKWGWTKQRAYQYIESTETVKALPAKSQPLVDSERAARALAEVPADQRVEVLKEAVKDGPVTAASIAEAAEEIVETEKPAKPKVHDVDKEGNVIPDLILEDWKHAEEVGKKVYALLTEVRDIVKKGLDGKRDIAFAEIANPTLAEIDSLRYTLSQILPHALCPSCSGKTRKTCIRCRLRGWLSKFLYKNTTSEKERGKK